MSGRYNRTSIDNRDRLPVDPTGARGSLNGQYVFDRFNPAVSVTYSPSRLVSLYFNYSEANRSPTAIELGCADQGVEVNVSGQFHHLIFGGNYTFLNATYESPQIVGGGSNNTNDEGIGLEGNIAIQPGDSIPLIPRNLFKAYADYQPTKKIMIDLDFVAAGRSFARGNENNLAQPDGIYYLGRGFSPGYGVVNLRAQYQLLKRVQVFVQINNLLDHHYYTAAQLGPTPYDNAGNFIARPFPSTPDGDYPIRNTTFYAPGAPIGAWGGIKFGF